MVSKSVLVVETMRQKQTEGTVANASNFILKAHPQRKHLSPAERQKRYRERRDADPNRRAEHLLKIKEARMVKKQAGKIKGAAELSQEEHDRLKQSWRTNQQRKRNREKLKTMKIESTL